MKQTILHGYLATEKPLTDFKQTIEEIVRLAEKYWTDLIEPNRHNVDFQKLTFKQFFDFIKSLPYVADPSGVEFISRPSICLALDDHYFDCDDRSECSLCFIFLKNYLVSKNIKHPIQARIDATGRFNKPHHVFVSYKIPSITDWVTLDPTYPKNQFGIELFPAGYRYTRFIE